MTLNSTPHRKLVPRSLRYDARALKKRTRIIERLKYGLPSLALGGFLILFAWPQAQLWLYGQKPNLAATTISPLSKNRVTQPEYKGVNKNNQPYTITAHEGIETSAEEIDLISPQMTIDLKSKDRVTLTSKTGKLNKLTNKIQLVGDVTLTHTQGYTLQTPQAWIDFHKGDAYSNDSVWGNGPLGHVSAQGFRLTEKGHKIHFEGNAQLLLTLSKEGKR